jgi:two-component system sensor histidine kinase KdpD
VPALVLLAADADLTVAAIVLFLAVVIAALLGYRAGLLAAVEAFLLLTYFFVPPRESFAVDRADDLIALAAFLSVAALIAAMVARLNELRAQSSLAAREAAVRLRTTDELLRGRPADRVARQLCEDLVELFELATCDVRVDSVHASATTGLPPLAQLEIRHGPLVVGCGLGRVLAVYEHATLEALVADVGAGFDRARLAEEAKRHELAAEVDRSRAGFLTAMTHDLRTPLATIKAAIGAVLMSAEGLDGSVIRELLDGSYHEVAHLEELVTQVLDVARIRAGALQPEPMEVAVTDAVRGATRRLRALSAGRQVTLAVDPDVPDAWVDPAMFERALLNVLENAFHYTDPTSAIEITATARASLVEVRVVDHGRGIAGEDRARVFDEFARLEGSEVKGVGLGLAIVRAFMAANGGDVWCEETPGGGATFVLTMPIVRNPLEDVEPSAPAATRGAQ